MKRRTIVISDLHLPTPDAKPDRLLAFLENHPCETLIINGDLIDKRYLRFFGKREAKHDEILRQIQQIGKKNQTHIIYLQGNHEKSRKHVTSVFEHPLQETTITSGGKTYLVCHGDSFEKEMSEPNFFNISLSLIGYFVAWIDRNLRTNYRISHFLEKVYGFLFNQKTRFIKNAIAHAKRKKVDGVICGHIHTPQIQMIDGIQYMNSGNRTDNCSALIENGQGEREIVYPK